MTAWRDESVGTFVITAIDVFGITGYVTSTSNAANLGIDAVDNPLPDY